MPSTLLGTRDTEMNETPQLCSRRVGGYRHRPATRMTSLCESVPSGEPGAGIHGAVPGDESSPLPKAPQEASPALAFAHASEKRLAHLIPAQTLPPSEALQQGSCAGAPLTLSSLPCRPNKDPGRRNPSPPGIRQGSQSALEQLTSHPRAAGHG